MSAAMKLVVFVVACIVFLAAPSVALGCMGGGMMCMGGLGHSSTHTGGETQAGSAHGSHSTSFAALGDEAKHSHGAAPEKSATHSESHAGSASKGESTAAKAILDRAAVDGLVDHYMSIWAALAKDSLDGLRDHAGEIRGNSQKMMKSVSTEGAEGETQDLKGILGQVEKEATSLAQATEIAAARDSFGKLSDDVLRLLENVAPRAASAQQGGKTIHVFRCDMVKKIWLQETEELRNPYMGSSMLKCGMLLKKVRV